MELVQRDSSDFDQEITGPGLPHLGTKGEVLVLANQHEKVVAPGDPRVHSEVGHAFCRSVPSLVCRGDRMPGRSAGTGDDSFLIRTRNLDAASFPETWKQFEIASSGAVVLISPASSY